MLQHLTRGARKAICSLIGTAAMLAVAPATAELIVNKVSSAYFTRTYQWEIDKVGSVTALTLPVGATQDVDYTVTVEKVGFTDSAFFVHSEISILYNPDPPPPGTPPGPLPPPDPILLTGVQDVFNGTPGGVLDPFCAGISSANPYLLQPGSFLTCMHDIDLLAPINGTNVATFSYLDPLSGAALDVSGSYDVAFGDPTVEIDECANVSDSRFGALGTLCGSATIQYSLSVGPYGSPGNYFFENTAALVTNDNGATRSDDWSVEVTVPAPEPGTLALLGLGLAGLAATRMRKK